MTWMHFVVRGSKVDREKTESAVQANTYPYYETVMLTFIGEISSDLSHNFFA
ncbi:hypothetical protein Smp_152040 [Schistosoma mansoni]|uniref:DUF1330 domain-containing protein n=1 Tax=Schistosoma mansoni TaxID=6183 RepID=G4VB92_SCHMA|nr:hypothetical protein Smp_152040 [Schistosoma mansoni]|eukprot:XP_018649475.1 hypothetical protein Smp_152040 [Schistosoma mansoni]